MKPRLPADIVLERLRTDLPVRLVGQLKRLNNSMLRVAMDESEMMKVRSMAVKNIDIIASRIMDVLGQPQRPKVANLKRRRGSGSGIDMDGVINVPSDPAPPSMDLVPVSESGPPPTSPDLAQFM